MTYESNSIYSFDIKSDSEVIEIIIPNVKDVKLIEKGSYEKEE
jgi:hypothetical protein